MRAMLMLSCAMDSEILYEQSTTDGRTAGFSTALALFCGQPPRLGQRGGERGESESGSLQPGGALVIGGLPCPCRAGPCCAAAAVAWPYGLCSPSFPAQSLRHETVASEGMVLLDWSYIALDSDGLHRRTPSRSKTKLDLVSLHSSIWTASDFLNLLHCTALRRASTIQQDH